MEQSIQEWTKYVEDSLKNFFEGYGLLKQTISLNTF